MQNAPRPRRRGPRRRRPERPTQAPAQPTPPPATRGSRPPATRGSRPPQQRPRQRPRRAPDDLPPGTPCVVLLDCREGEPDRTGSAAVFEGFFDFETGDLRHAGRGIPRLRILPADAASAVPADPRSGERVWGFECWWRVDADRAGLTPADREELETSKRLLRGLIRDSRRQTRLRTEVPVPARTTVP